MKRLQNFSDLFSRAPLSETQLPKIRKTASISKHAVKKRVLDALESEPVPESIRRKSFVRRTVAIAAAAALGISGCALTAVAANGGFQTLAQIVFGKDVTYPDSVETLYAVPKATITNTCDAIDCQVLGVFGNENTATIVLEFFGVNGNTLPEDLCFYSEDTLFDSFQLQSDSEKKLDCYGEQSWSYDCSDNGHLYLTETVTFENANSSDGSIQYALHSGILLQDSKNRSRTYQSIYSMFAIRCWLGQTNAEINAEKPLSSEEEARIADAFLEVSQDSDGNGVIADAERQFIPKEDVYAEGSISLEFPLEYPVAEPVTQNFTYSDPEIGTETPMELQLTPWGATFIWNAADPTPVFENCSVVEGDDKTVSAMNILSAAILYTAEDGTTHKQYFSGSTILLPEDAAVESYELHLNLTFQQPVDPAQVTAVYMGDYKIWSKDGET